jgi:FkbM family methyltransferase
MSISLDMAHRLSTALVDIAKLHRGLSSIRNSDLPRALRSEMTRALMRLAHPRDPASLMGYRVSYFEPGQLRYLFREIFLDASYLFRAKSEAPLILDCGSNIGMSILFFKKLYPAARIVGFEPDPVTFAKLQQNVEQNGLQDVELHQCALSASDGSIEFFRSTERDGDLKMSVLPARMRGQRIVVPARRLSSFITEPVDLLKMDIEGAEADVLPELASSGKLDMVDQMHIEYHHNVQGARDSLSATLKVIEDAGFGYQVGAPPSLGKWPRAASFQDISIYCYSDGERQ